MTSHSIHPEDRYAMALHDVALHMGLDPTELRKTQELIIDDVPIVFFLVVDDLGGSLQSACFCGRLPELTPDLLLQRIPQANTLGPVTGGAAIGPQHEGKQLVLARRDPLDIPVEQLAHQMCKLADAATHWSKAAEAGFAGVTDGPAAITPPTPTLHEEPSMPSYPELLKSYAHLIHLPSADEFLLNQEVEVRGVKIGLNLEGDMRTGDIVFFTDLGLPAPAVRRDKLMLLMLQANAMWAGTGGGTLGIQAGSSTILLCGRAPLQLCDAQALAAGLDAFSQISLLWAEIIKGNQPVQLPEPVSA